MNDVDILTNTGFLRPIDSSLINKLSSQCVIPLMWEPWELREDEIDISLCRKKGIKVYGTNESDDRLMTMKYIGFIVLYYLLASKLTCFSAKVLLIGNNEFVGPMIEVLQNNDYNFDVVKYKDTINVENYNFIVVAEHKIDQEIIGNQGSFIKNSDIPDDTIVLHIAGNVSFEGARYKYIPNKPSCFGHMSFTTDYIDPQAVIDLHTAGLKVAEGMLEANRLGLDGMSEVTFLESNYPALAIR